jgi:hypothetical protein
VSGNSFFFSEIKLLRWNMAREKEVKDVSVDAMLPDRLHRLKFRKLQDVSTMFDMLIYLAGDVDRYLQLLKNKKAPASQIERELNNIEYRLNQVKEKNNG